MTPDKISVIIVTYNVSGFITFCIDSIKNSNIDTEIEIIIVDNNSSDDTIGILQSEYNDLTVISNTKNRGFSKACNQGAAVANGQLLLFLNPDSIVSELAIDKMSGQFRSENIGLVGPMLVDGRGNYLPESAREMPTTRSAISKILRLPIQKNFPYYRNIDDNNVIDAPVLSGACMMIRKDLFDEVEGFDERFFMYGEDVDLSVRIIQKGFKNLCIPEARVIHFKGESTDRSSFVTNEHFYKAIAIYREKHYSKNDESIKSHGFNIATVLFAAFRFSKELLSRFLPVIGDFVLIFLTIWILQFIWSYIKIGHVGFYENFRYVVYYVFYSMVWVFALALSGSYFKNSKTPQRYFKGALLGSVLVITIYSLLPIHLRFSRGIIVLSVLVVPLMMLLKFWLRKKVFTAPIIFVTNDLNENSCQYVFNKKIDKAISYNSEVEVNKNSNYIFDFNNLASDSIINFMVKLEGNSKFEFWDRKRNYLFSSSTKTNRGVGLNKFSNYNLSQDVYQLHKRLFDITAVLIFFIPIFVIKIFSGKWNFDTMRNLISGSKTVVGYKNEKEGSGLLPLMPECLVLCYDENVDSVIRNDKALTYASKYTIFDDAYVVITNFVKFIKALID